MIENLPVYISLIFILTTLLTVWLFYMAANHSKPTLLILLTWLVLQGAIGLSGFYTNTHTLPPRFLLLVLPPFLLIIGLFMTSGGRKYIDKLDIRILTILHVIRIPVELVLFWLFINKAVPELMTFKGSNPDILSGITAPFIYYYGFIKKQVNSKLILLWNFLCLGLLLNIVVIALLTAPFPFQTWAFDQPNIAILYFPFNWLPACIVPLVLLSHLASIRQILTAQRNQTALKT